MTAAEEAVIAVVEAAAAIEAAAAEEDDEITRKDKQKQLYLCQTFFKNKSCYSQKDRNIENNRRVGIEELPPKEVFYHLALLG
jgi:hypothetical protein